MFSSIVRPDLTTSKAESLFLINTVCFFPVQSAYLLRPSFMVFAKCVPHSIAEVMMGLLITIVKLNTELLMRLLSLWLVKGYDITIEDFSHLSDAMKRGSCYSIAGILLVGYVFNRKEYMVVQSVIHRIDSSMTKEELQSLNLDLECEKQKAKRLAKKMKEL